MSMRTIEVLPCSARNACEATGRRAPKSARPRDQAKGVRPQRENGPQTRTGRVLPQPLCVPVVIATVLCISCAPRRPRPPVAPRNQGNAQASSNGSGVAQGAVEPQRVELKPPFVQDEGHMYGVRLPSSWLSDSSDEQRLSTVKVWEDSMELGPAHSVHTTIRAIGHGAYSHWLGYLYFSSSDNTDPNTNGRTYTVEVPRAAGLGERLLRPRINTNMFSEIDRDALDKRREAALTRPILASRPRLIYWFTIDALRADVVGAAHNGTPIMPSLSEFAKESVTFTNAYAQGGMTKISVASMFTGLWPARHAVMAGVVPTPNRTVLGDNGVRVFSLDPRFYTLPEYLTDQGYETWTHLFTVHVEPGDGMLQGFNRLDLDDTGGSPFDRVPRFLFVYEHILGLHAPYAPSDRAKTELRLHAPSLVDPAGPHWMGTEIGRAKAAELKEAYLAEGNDADRIFARTMGAIRAQGLWDDAMIIVTADHGEEFTEHGNTEHGRSLYEEVIHVPLFVKFPKSSKYSEFHGSAYGNRVRHVDLFPTIVELIAGPATPYPLDGVSLGRALDGEEGGLLARDVYARHAALHRPEDSRSEVPVLDAVLAGRMKAIFGYQSLPPHASHVPMTAEERWIAELYDLVDDPGEHNDLAADHIHDFLRLAAQSLASSSDPLRGNGRAEQPTQTQPDRDLIEEMRALGYIDQ